MKRNIQFSFGQTALVTAAAVVVVDYVLKINGDLSNFCQGFKRGTVQLAKEYIVCKSRMSKREPCDLCQLFSTCCKIHCWHLSWAAKNVKALNQKRGNWLSNQRDISTLDMALAGWRPTTLLVDTTIFDITISSHSALDSISYHFTLKWAKIGRNVRKQKSSTTTSILV